MWVVSLYTYFTGKGGRFRLKSVKKCVFVTVLKIALLPVKSVFINVKKGMSELWRWVAAKHTTIDSNITDNICQEGH